MLAIGVDIGGTKIAAGVVDDDGTIVAQTRRDTDASDAHSVDQGVVDVCRELMADHDVAAIGLAAPGFVSSDRATVNFTPNLPWRDHPLRDEVVQALRTDVPVVVENDANAAGWAEFQFGNALGVPGATDWLLDTNGLCAGDTFTITAATAAAAEVPEPSTALLAMTALLGMTAAYKRKRQ